MPGSIDFVLEQGKSTSMRRGSGLKAIELVALLSSLLVGAAGCDGPNRGERLRLIAVDIYYNQRAECYALNQCAPGSCPELPYFIGASGEECLQGMTAEMYADYERSFHCLRIATEQALHCAEQCIVPCPYEPSADCRDIFNFPVRDIRDIPDACLPHSTSSDTPAADASAPPVSDDAATPRAYCEYLDRCYPEALAMYPTGTLAGCLDVPECHVFHSFWLGSAECREFLGSDACTVPLTRFGLNGAQLNFPEGSPCAAPAADYSGLARQTDGERCIGFELSCDEGLYCLLDTPAKLSGSYFCGTCMLPIPLGESCSLGEQCESGAHCEQNRCVETRANGASCSDSTQCQSKLCFEGECADENEVFHNSEPVSLDGHALGEPCDASGAPCIEDVTLACVDGRCVSRPDVGDACDDGFYDCRLGQGCDSGRCVALACVAEPSGFCGGATRCPSGWYCGADQHCVRRPGPGEPCDSLGVCGLNLVCLDDRCSEPPSLPNGTACREHVQCRSGRCLRDLTAYCDVGATGYDCSIPQCETDCGVCGDEPGVAGCD
ncbi:MAG TPA: hypothetical protein VHO25_21720 [Polyangiaceae bacterium]|nr:hypothetical protein [Polyangiaceae bacterium]